jgi:glycosyltransferase involved in cell wall biosynthesis
MGGITLRFRRELRRIASIERPDVAWIDSDAYSILIGDIRRYSPQTKIVVFCHNIESDYYATQAEKGLSGMKMRILSAVAGRLGRRTARQADAVIHLHALDADRFQALYGRKSKGIIPVSFDPPPPRAASSRKGACTAWPFESYYLFVGTLFKPNYDGCLWFVKNVLPLAPGNLVIAGKGFESVAGELESDRCRVLGFVDDLTELYDGADFVIAPIFSGGGMKVKTGEALSRGKLIVGSSEALRGYSVTPGREAIVCDDARAFIAALSDLYRNGSPPRVCPAARELYLKEHTTEAAWGFFSAAMETIMPGASI